jgi:di/tricarboxylate transporter
MASGKHQWPLILLLLLLIPLFSTVDSLETPSQRFAQLDINHYQKCEFFLMICLTLCTSFITYLYISNFSFTAKNSECYDPNGNAQRCVPDFINAGKPKCHKGN